ncbi:MAG: hypothetical protein QW483_01255 [Nanopusillaceae archaeon]
MKSKRILPTKNFFNKPNWKYLGLDIVKGVNVDTLVNDLYE